MGVRFTVLPSARLVAYVVEGDATPDDARAFLDAVKAHPEYKRGFDFIGDRRAVDRAPSSGYVYAVADEVNLRHESLAPCRWAVVVEGELAYGRAKTWGVVTARAKVEIRPFRTAEAAAEWLGVPAAYSPLDLIPAG
jgi:hypothetical protein